MFFAVSGFLLFLGLAFSAYPCYTRSIVSLVVSWFLLFFPGFLPLVSPVLVPLFPVVVLWRRRLFRLLRVCLLVVRVA